MTPSTDHENSSSPTYYSLVVPSPGGEAAASSSSAPSSSSTTKIDALCIGSGRFQRSVLVPALNGSGLHPAILQTRGRSFLDHCRERYDGDGGASSSTHLTYEVDTVEYDGLVATEHVSCYGAGTLGSPGGKQAAMDLLGRMENITVIGVGVTEAGLANSSTQVLLDLADVLRRCHSLMYPTAAATTTTSAAAGRHPLACPNPNGRICVISTDNVPNNGKVIRRHLLDIAYRYEQAADDEGGENGGGDNDGESDVNYNNNNNNNNNNENASSDRSPPSFVEFLCDRVTFHDTMVDRITSQREGSNGMVPRCEPVPAKALVVEDLEGDLPRSFGSTAMRQKFGVVVRTKANQLDGDIALKLRVANGTHTAVAHTMALSELLLTDVLSSSSSSNGDDNINNENSAALLMDYLDSFFEAQILLGAADDFGEEETRATYDDWRKRLRHPHFGLSSFFITQNGAAKGGIRIGPTIQSLLKRGKSVSVSTAFAIAAILRWLTPVKAAAEGANARDGVYRGWLDRVCRPANSSLADGAPKSGGEKTVTYADGLKYNLSEGWYEFRCACSVQLPTMKEPLPLSDVLATFGRSEQPRCYEKVVEAYLTKSDGGGLSDVSEYLSTKAQFGKFVRAVSSMYARMISGDGMLHILEEMTQKNDVFAEGLASDCSVLLDGISDVERGDFRPLSFQPGPIPDSSKLLGIPVKADHDAVSSVVFAEVSSARAIDLHTHLLPPSHGSLCLWGIDELLTYHYLVAEYFMTAPSSVTPADFYALSKQKQADIIWKALFIERSPISEACRGVITTLTALGLNSEVRARDLSSIREWYDSYRKDGLPGSERFSEKVYSLAGVRYAIMTNIPFDSNEAQHWRPKRKEYPKQFRSALRVDPLLAGDRKTIEAALRSSGYDNTLEGARQYLRDWCDTMQPEYMMASTPHNFVLPEDRGNLSGIKKTGVNEDAMKQPFAFTDVTGSSSACNNDCDGEEDATASLINERSDFLSEVLMKVCEERDLPVALKIGAHRGVNPQLLTAGDGVVAFADAGALGRLCNRFPKVRFLATFLSRNNQQEACVLASKFRNLHIYGCWWFCNNPSIIKEITQMRIEMLGSAFTAQHSDARVLDQLIYKWSHSRAVIAAVLAKEYVKLIESGWTLTRGEIRRDVKRLFGGSYEDFMNKSFAL